MELLEKLTVTQLLSKFPAFMEPKGLLLYPQEPTTEPCCKPDESILHFHTLFI
jgi:hypothetical protein